MRQEISTCGEDLSSPAYRMLSKYNDYNSSLSGYDYISVPHQIPTSVQNNDKLDTSSDY